MLLKFGELGGSRLDSGASGKLVKTSRVIVARRGVERAAGAPSPSFFHARGFTQRQQKANGELAPPLARRVGIVGDAQEGREENLSLVSESYSSN